MPRNATLNSKITSILKTLGIIYTDEHGNAIPVKIGKLTEVAPLHSKVKLRLYLEMMGEGGIPFYQIIGVITEPLAPGEVVDLKLKAEFNDRSGKKQIWINEIDFEQVRVIIPTGHKSIVVRPTEKTVNKNGKTKEGFGNYFFD